jgi:hypothetical protein
MLPVIEPLVVPLPICSVPVVMVQFWLPVPVTTQVEPPIFSKVVKPVYCVPISSRLNVPVPIAPPS